MSNFAKTSKGSELPLLKLKGKDYLLIAHRLLWLNDDYSNFTITTDIVQLTETYAVVRAQVVLFGPDGQVLRSATASKRETQKDFADFLEKAETGSIGRALAMVGLGTQFCQQDMEEGTRLADAPLEAPKKAAKPRASAAKLETETDAVIGAMNVIEGSTTPELLNLTGATEEVITSATSGSFRRDRVAVASATAPITATKGGWR